MTTNVENSLPSYNNLPDAFAISLAEYGAIALHGEEQSKYLQGQVTCDVNTLEDNNLLLGAHCDAKGKVFSVFRLINRQNTHLLLQPKASIDVSLTELKKFGVFAKVTIEQTTNLAFYAVVGKNASKVLHQQFDELPNSLTPVLQVGTTTIVYLAGKLKRYLIIDQAEIVDKIKNLPKKNTIYLLAPIVRGRKGEYKKEIASYKRRGFQKQKYRFNLAKF